MKELDELKRALTAENRALIFRTALIDIQELARRTHTVVGKRALLDIINDAAQEAK